MGGFSVVGSWCFVASELSSRTHDLRSFRRPIHETRCVLLLLLREKIAERIDVVAESVTQLASYGANFCDHWIFDLRIHGASNSSGVQTIGGS
jgi:hypothetical protein